MTRALSPVRRSSAVPTTRPPALDRRFAEVVHAPAVIDLATAPAFAAALAAARRRHPRVVVADLSAVEFCDSTALDVLLAAEEDLVAQQCALELVDPPAMLIRMAKLLGLSVRLGLPG